MKNLVIVESPAKAKTINKYLGKDYHVLASYGHVRDLPSKDGSVLPDNDFEMIYEVDGKSVKHVQEIASEMKSADALYLATDPDREGEAISWHILEALKEKKALKKGVAVKRVVFNAITKNSVTEAMKAPRDIDMDLVNAQQARRALDYLVGFNLSPVLWRKLPGSRSAGRVQSVALRLICDREEEIEKFVTQEYWDIKLDMLSAKNVPFQARLYAVEGKKLEKFSIPNEARAKEITARLEGRNCRIVKIEEKQARRNPYPPFTTSTLQQEASRKLGFGAKKTMQIAQKLYEGVDLGGETVGLITYMRTDGVQVAPEAIASARELIGKKYGQAYLPKAPREYKTKAKNAQEAHEAIRPTEVSRAPESVESYLDQDQARLYSLIWKRMVASQMESAVFDQVVAEIETEDKYGQLRATGSVLRFDGFQKVYREDRDDRQDDDDESRELPPLAEGEKTAIAQVRPEQHFTEPPPRYSEASLVKKLEEMGIGRPSTYASIISVLQDRNYVRLESKRFFPEERGRLVTSFLVQFFRKYVEYDFTAGLEEELDQISAGEIDWKKVLRNFWSEFSGKVEEVKGRKTSEVLDEMDEVMGAHIFQPGEDGKDPRSCPKCGNGRLGLKVGKFGAFIGCSNYPECAYTRQIAGSGEKPEGGEAEEEFKSKILGTDPRTGLEVSLRKGPYGYYLQLGEEIKKGKKKEKPKRMPAPKGGRPEDITLEQACQLLSLPREIGPHPESGKMITAGIGRFGPYLNHDGKYKSLKDDDVLSVGINRAVELLAAAGTGKGEGGGFPLLKDLGSYKGKAVEIRKGRFGPYIKYGKINVSIPKKISHEELALEDAVELIKKKA